MRLVSTDREGQERPPSKELAVGRGDKILTSGAGHDGSLTLSKPVDFLMLYTCARYDYPSFATQSGCPIIVP